MNYVSLTNFNTHCVSFEVRQVQWDTRNNPYHPFLSVILESLLKFQGKDQVLLHATYQCPLLRKDAILDLGGKWNTKTSDKSRLND